MELEVEYIKSCKNQVIIYLEAHKVVVFTDKAINNEYKRYVQSRLPGYTLIEKR